MVTVIRWAEYNGYAAQKYFFEQNFDDGLNIVTCEKALRRMFELNAL